MLDLNPWLKVRSSLLKNYDNNDIYINATNLSAFLDSEYTIINYQQMHSQACLVYDQVCNNYEYIIVCVFLSTTQMNRWDYFTFFFYVKICWVEVWRTESSILSFKRDIIDCYARKVAPSLLATEYIFWLSSKHLIFKISIRVSHEFEAIRFWHSGQRLSWWVNTHILLT